MTGSKVAQKNHQDVPSKVEKLKKDWNFLEHIVWESVIVISGMHVMALYGLYLSFTSAKLITSIYTYIAFVITGMGITVGSHRLWSHRAFKANLPLRIFLMLCHTATFQYSLWDWCRNHRVHHKFSETDADPHNSRRGTFFAHAGWLMARKHPDVTEKGKLVDMSDLDADPVITFQRKYYLILMPIFAFILPIIIPVYGWNETWKNSIFIAGLLRWAWTVNVTWFTNSIGHRHGNQPYDKNINPGENTFVNFTSLGEGYHNYHHVFPWDWKAAELPNITLNWSTGAIRFYAHMGWAYDLKAPTQDIVKQRVLRTGDGSHTIWGWGDKDQTSKEIKSASITYPKAL